MLSPTTDQQSPATLILLGKILSPHGLKGQVKVASYAGNPENLTAYGPLFDKTGGREFRLTPEGRSGDAMLARVTGVTTREAAENLRNVDLYVPRTALPEPEGGQFYQSDLIGLPVVTQDGQPFGILAGFHNFGAGDVAEIRDASGHAEWFGFTPQAFSVDLAAGKIIIVPPQVVE